MTVRPAQRFPLLLLGIVSLISALWTGLLRLDWPLPSPHASFKMAHGPLMLSGFLGTLISLERAVALSAPWGYAAPLLSAAGGLALVVAPTSPAGAALMTLGSGVLVLIFAVMVRRERAMHTAVMFLAAALWLAGNGYWLVGFEIPDVVGWWVGFLVLTIAAERLELTRVLQPSRFARSVFAAAVALLVAGLGIRAIARPAGTVIAGGAFLLLAMWLLRCDIARRTVRQRGLTRFVAICLLSGYVWLATAGALWMLHPDEIAGRLYDASLHAALLGFVFTMIFAHAPIIFPAVLGVAVPFRPAFYVHVAVLHASLVLRVGSDLLDWGDGRQWGGLINALAIVLFFANTIRAVVLGRRPIWEPRHAGGECV